MKRFWRRMLWYGCKLPILLVVIMIGFALEYLFMLPFMMACLLAGPYPRRRRHS